MSVKAKSITFEFYGVIATDWELFGSNEKGKKMVIPYTSISYIRYLDDKTE